VNSESQVPGRWGGACALVRSWAILKEYAERHMAWTKKFTGSRSLEFEAVTLLLSLPCLAVTLGGYEYVDIYCDRISG
jgi:hypothetical protein